MIKRNTMLALMLLFFGAAIAQTTFTGKPKYQILTKRAGNFLGIINIELYPAIAPNHTRNFDSLVNIQFFDSTAFHRVIPGFVIQGGDPNSRHGPISTWGYGDPSQQTVNAEFTAAQHLRGRLSAARDNNINSANSQFFICVAPQASLNGQYSVYGNVTSGMNIVDTIVNSPRDVNDNPLQKIEMFVTYIGSNDTIPNAPALNTPASGTQNVGASKQLKWNAVSDAVYYYVEVSTDSLFTTIFSGQTMAGLYTVAVALNPSTTYYWRVKTNNGGHWSSWSQVWNFSTTMNSAVNNLPFLEKGYRLDQNVPNPVNGQTSIRYVTPGRSNVSIKLYDADGREVAVLVNEKKDKGEYHVIVDMNKYSSGTYFYRMQVGDVADTKKLILER